MMYNPQVHFDPTEYIQVHNSLACMTLRICCMVECDNVNEFNIHIHTHTYIHTNTHTYIHTQTASGNRISRSADIVKPQSLEIPTGRVIIKSGVRVQCDLAPVSLNKYAIVSEDTVLVPAALLTNDGDRTAPAKYIPMTIGSHTCESMSTFVSHVPIKKFLSAIQSLFALA
jgi:hypothetical protein